MLTSRQRGYLTGRAQTLDAFVTLGKAGGTDALAARLDTLLADHELVKLRFGDFKDERRRIAGELAAKTTSELVRVIGYTAVFFRPNPDPTKRRIELPVPAPVRAPEKPRRKT